MNERQKIQQVLVHAIEQGENVKYEGVRFYKIHNTTISEYNSELKKELEIKSKLFDKVDDKSHTYRIIYCHAKLALDFLKQGLFEVRSAELINLFLSLQSVFENGLEYVSVKELEESIEDNKDLEKYKKTESEEEKQNRLKIIKRKHRNIVYIEEGITAGKLKKKKIKEEEFEETLSLADDLNFEEDKDINSLEF